MLPQAAVPVIQSEAHAVALLPREIPSIQRREDDQLAAPSPIAAVLQTSSVAGTCSRDRAAGAFLCMCHMKASREKDCRSRSRRLSRYNL